MKPINYSNTIIYKIVCNDLSVKDVYVGHTTNFTQRKSNHRRFCNNENTKKYNYKIYEIIRANGGWENFTMVEIEKNSCKDGNEARARERYWYEQLQANMNKLIPNRTNKEYNQDNKEIIKENMKEYREKNKVKLYEQKKEYLEINKEIVKERRKKYEQNKKEEIRNKNKIRYQLNKEISCENKKTFYQKNREQLCEKRAQYRMNNKEIINEKQREKIMCECGLEICKNHKLRHEQSLKHKQYLEQSITV